jgi:hypothetical protein
MLRILAFGFAALLSVSLCLQASAQIVVDGTLDAMGYTRVATQMVDTQFGDAMAPDYFGSELDAMYVGQDGSRLFVLLTGNLEGNFNKLEVFFDSVAGGENTLSSMPQYDFLAGGGPNWQSQLLGGIVSGGPGLRFDAGFNVDYHLFFRRGFAGKAGNVFDADFVDRMGGGMAMVPGNTVRAVFDFPTQTAADSIVPGSLGMNSSGDAINMAIDVAINNSNVLGVAGGSGAANMAAAEAVTTGIEFSIDVSDLGLNPNAAATIKLVAMVNGSSHDYLSNQMLPALAAGTGNLGGDGAGNFIGDLGFVNLTTFAGDQFFCYNYMPFLLGDVNCDGVVNLLDVAPFVALLTTGGYSAKADINGDGLLNLLDVAGFVSLLSGG